MAHSICVCLYFTYLYSLVFGWCKMFSIKWTWNCENRTEPNQTVNCGCYYGNHACSTYEPNFNYCRPLFFALCVCDCCVKTFFFFPFPNIRRKISQKVSYNYHASSIFIIHWTTKYVSIQFKRWKLRVVSLEDGCWNVQTRGLETVRVMPVEHWPHSIEIASSFFFSSKNRCRLSPPHIHLFARWHFPQ